MKNSEFNSQYKPTLSLRLSFSWLCRVSDFFSATRKQVLSSSSLDLFSSKECSSIRLVIWYLSRASTADARLVSKAFSLAWVWTKSQTLIYIKIHYFISFWSWSDNYWRSFKPWWRFHSFSGKVIFYKLLQEGSFSIFSYLRQIFFEVGFLALMVWFCVW